MLSSLVSRLGILNVEQSPISGCSVCGLEFCRGGDFCTQFGFHLRTCTCGEPLCLSSAEPGADQGESLCSYCSGDIGGCDCKMLGALYSGRCADCGQWNCPCQEEAMEDRHDFEWDGDAHPIGCVCEPCVEEAACRAYIAGVRAEYEEMELLQRQQGASDEVPF